MADCVIGLKSATLAERARRAAVYERIAAEVVSLDPSVTRRGCSFGLRLACEETGRMKNLLDRMGIPCGDVIGKEGGRYGGDPVL